MSRLMTATRLARLAAVLAAGAALMAAADIASAKGDRHNDSSARTTNTIHPIVVKESKGSNKRKDSRRERKDKDKKKEAKEGGNCGKRCRAEERKKEREAAKQNVPVTITGAAGSTKIRVAPGETLGFSAGKDGLITVTEFTGKPGLRQVTFGGGSITLSSSVANALRLTASNGKAGNIGVDGTVKVKQNPDGSVTVTAAPPVLKGL